ncbi:hypothetical protein PIB30_110287, partial [Stylosanthes scabra]|nr:hypothetical protein [Stylosanthes scabra]
MYVGEKINLQQSLSETSTHVEVALDAGKAQSNHTDQCVPVTRQRRTATRPLPAVTTASTRT